MCIYTLKHAFYTIWRGEVKNLLLIYKDIQRIQLHNNLQRKLLQKLRGYFRDCIKLIGYYSVCRICTEILDELSLNFKDAKNMFDFI